MLKRSFRKALKIFVENDLWCRSAIVSKFPFKHEETESKKGNLQWFVGQTISLNKLIGFCDCFHKELMKIIRINLLFENFSHTEL